MNLAELQKRTAAAIMAPLTAADGMAGDDRIPSFDEVHAEARKAERYLPAANLVTT